MMSIFRFYLVLVSRAILVLVFVNENNTRSKWTAFVRGLLARNVRARSQMACLVTSLGRYGSGSYY